jgi:hypothetical protein
MTAPPNIQVLGSPAQPVCRSGLGYRGDFHDGSIQLQLGRTRRERGDLTGMLTVTHDERCLYRGKFNSATVTSRSSLVRYLKERDGGYAGWAVVVEEFCWHVLEMEDAGPDEMTVGDLPARERTPLLLDPILPMDAATIIFGPHESFKSMIAAAIAMSVQLGVPVVPGWMPQRSGKVLILDWEAGSEAWNDRIVKIANGLGVTPPVIQYRRCQHKLADFAETIAATVDRLNIELVIVDSIGLAQGSNGEGDANEATIRLFAALRVIGATSLLIDHVRGDELGNARPSSKPYGSTYKVNLARAVFEMRKEEAPVYNDATQVLLRHTKVNDGPHLPAMGLRFITGQSAFVIERRPVDAPDLEQLSGSTTDRTRRLLRSGPLAEAEIAETLGVTRAAIRQLIRRNQGFERLSDGRIGVVA